MILDECTSTGNFDDLDSNLQDEVLLNELSSKLTEVIKSAKDSRGVNFTTLISGFNLEISIEISERTVKSEQLPSPELAPQFFVKSTSLRKCWVYDEATGAQILVNC